MNNKKLGTAFEREVVEYIRGSGAWVHFADTEECKRKERRTDATD